MTATFTTRDGLVLPAVGFGTYRLTGADGVRTVASALDAGYRLLDSAMIYDNEGTVGRAVRASDVPREDVLVASKLPGRFHDRRAAVAAVEESLYRTGLDHLDLYLVHWPNPRLDRYVDAWLGLLDARERGLVREVGVCNFLPEHLERLERETGVLPVVNQVELHPYLPQVEALAWHRAHGVVTQAWTPLGRGNDLLDHPVVRGVAQRVGATPAQVVLAWHRHVGALPLPKAADPGRQRENLAAVAVTLDDDDVAALTALGRPDGRTTNQDPAVWQDV